MRAGTRAAIMAAAILAAGYLIATNNRPTPEAAPTTAVPIRVATTAATPGWGPGQPNYRLLINDCESGENGPTMPCVAWDEGEWRLVFHMGAGYRYQPLAACKTATKGPLYPCVTPKPEGDYRAVLMRTLAIN